MPPQGWFEPMPPDGVAYPESNEEVTEIVRICAASRTPLIPFGAGTSVEGHVMAVEGGVRLDLTRMDCMLEVHDADLDCRVQAGVTRNRLNEELSGRGLFFPIDPGADATLGGMVATGADYDDLPVLSSAGTSHRFTQHPLPDVESRLQNDHRRG